MRQRAAVILLPAVMATQRACTLPSDPDYLLSLMCEIEESDSDEEFDGWLDEDDGPTIVRSERSGSPTPLMHSLSIESLDLACEHPLPACSPSHSPMQLSTPTSPSPEASPSQGINPPEFTAQAGIIPNTEGMTPVDLFQLFFDERVIDLIFTNY